MSSQSTHEHRLARLHEVMTRHVTHGDVPGLVALVSRRGETTCEVIGNQRAGGGGDPMRRDSIFRISSMTKPITAVAAMILVEQCKLRLDDPVDALLPELANRRVLTSLDAPLSSTVPAQRPLTLRDLLTFRLGFGQVMALPDAYPILKAAGELQIGMGPPSPSSMPSPDEWIRRLGSLPLMYQPGERWLYNTGTDVLGVLIARASGQPFERFLREQVFEPLGMKDTGFFVQPSQLQRLCPCYFNDFTSGAFGVYDPAEGGQWSAPPAFASGSAGLVSTADDYLAFARMLLRYGAHGRERILSRPSVELITTDQLTPAQKRVSGFTPGAFDQLGWGFGLAIATGRDQLANVGSYGWDGGLGSSWRNDPKEDLVAILLTPRMWRSPNPPEVVRDFWTCAYQSITD